MLTHKCWLKKSKQTPPKANKATWICLWPWAVLFIVRMGTLLYKPAHKYGWADYKNLSYQKWIIALLNMNREWRNNFITSRGNAIKILALYANNRSPLISAVCTALAIYCMLYFSALTKISPKQPPPQELLRNLNNQCLVSANVPDWCSFFMLAWNSDAHSLPSSHGSSTGHRAGAENRTAVVFPVLAYEILQLWTRRVSPHRSLNRCSLGKSTSGSSRAAGGAQRHRYPTCRPRPAAQPLHGALTKEPGPKNWRRNAAASKGILCGCKRWQLRA